MGRAVLRKRGNLQSGCDKPSLEILFGTTVCRQHEHESVILPCSVKDGHKSQRALSFCGVKFYMSLRFVSCFSSVA